MARKQRWNFMLSKDMEDKIIGLAEEVGVNKSEMARHLIRAGLRTEAQSKHWESIGKKHGAYVGWVQSVPIFYGPPQATNKAIDEYEAHLLAEQALVRTSIKQTLAAMPAINNSEASAMAETAQMPVMTRPKQ